jgi:hypothetical protein
LRIAPLIELRRSHVNVFTNGCTLVGDYVHCGHATPPIQCQ